MKPIAPHDRLSSWLEQAWLERYLARKLDDQETEWFEMYVLDKPELIAAIEADNDLRDGMFVAHAVPEPEVVRKAHRSRHGKSRRILLPLAWAASAIACIGLGWFMASRLSADLPDTALEIVASPTRIVFDTLRGVEGRPQVYPGLPGSEYVLVEIGLPSDAQDIRVQLGESAHLPLMLSTDGFVGLLLRRSTLSDTSKLTIRYQVAGEEFTGFIEDWPDI